MVRDISYSSSHFYNASSYLSSFTDKTGSLQSKQCGDGTHRGQFLNFQSEIMALNPSAMEEISKKSVRTHSFY